MLLILVDKAMNFKSFTANRAGVDDFKLFC